MKRTPEYHVACGMAGIYAGTVKANGEEWRNKSLVTDEAINAVRDFLFDELHGNCGTNSREWTRKDGKTVTLTLEIKEAAKDEAQD